MNIGKLVRGAFTALFTAGLIFSNPTSALAKKGNVDESSEVDKTPNLAIYGGAPSNFRDGIFSIESYNNPSLEDNPTIRIVAQDLNPNGITDLLTLTRDYGVNDPRTVSITFFRGPAYSEHELDLIHQFGLGQDKKIQGCYLDGGRIKIRVTKDQGKYIIHAIDTVEDRDVYDAQNYLWRLESNHRTSEDNRLPASVIKDIETEVEFRSNVDSPGFLLKDNPLIAQIKELRDRRIPEHAMVTIEYNPYGCPSGIHPGYTDPRALEPNDVKTFNAAFETLDRIAADFAAAAQGESFLGIHDRTLAAGFPIEQAILRRYETEITAILGINPTDYQESPQANYLPIE